MKWLLVYHGHIRLSVIHTSEPGGRESDSSGALQKLLSTQSAVVGRSCSVSSVMSCFCERLHVGIRPSAFTSALIASILG